MPHWHTGRRNVFAARVKPGFLVRSPPPEHPYNLKNEQNPVIFPAHRSGAEGLWQRDSTPDQKYCAEKRRPPHITSEPLRIIGIPFRHTGEKSAPHYIRCAFGTPQNTVVYTAGMLSLCHHIAHLIQRPTFLIAGKSNGEFFIYITLKHAAQKPFKSAVILKNHISPCHTVHPAASNKDSCCISHSGNDPLSTASSCCTIVEGENRSPGAA